MTKKILSELPKEQTVYFIAVHNNNWLDEASDYEYTKDLADIRVLMDLCSSSDNISVIFIIATEKDLRNEKNEIYDKFEHLKSYITPKPINIFQLELWDFEGLLSKEKELGLYI